MYRIKRVDIPDNAALLGSGAWCRPRTDRAVVYWRDGPRSSS